MTLQITSVNSGFYDSDGRVLFDVDCGEITNVITHIFDTRRDVRNDEILKTWLLTNEPDPYVEPIVPDPSEDEIADERRNERRAIFAGTLDKMNTIWYNSLTTTQQDNLAIWRQAWLDYPATGTLPDYDLVSDIFD